MICKCGHEAEKHHHGKSCTVIVDNFKLKYCKCEQFREQYGESNLTEEGATEMAKAKKTRSASVRSVREPGTRLVVRYEPTAKDGKDLLDKENASQGAAMYRALVAAKGPLTIKEAYAACEGKMESTAAWERLGKNKNSTLFALRNAGFVKKTEKREEVAAGTRRARSAKPRASHPRAARKPRKTAAKAQETASTREAATA